MKAKYLILMLGLLGLKGWSQPMAGSFTNSVVSLIPVGNPVGLVEKFTVSSLSGSISNVQVTLDITGGFNGNLYAYLVNPLGQMAVLLNRPGVTGSNPFGYSDAGMNITLDGLAVNNIHNYGSGSYSLSGTTWAADGRNINPQSAGSVFDAASTAANLSVYQNTAADGIWTFFIADLGAGGGTPELNSVILSIVTVPEPQTWALLGGGLTTICLMRRRL
jgi:subtilisin-like proprotein convertase family protein